MLERLYMLLTSSALFRSGVASLLMFTWSVGLLLAGCGAAPRLLAEPRVGDLSPGFGPGGGEGITMSRGTGVGNQGDIRPTARPLQMFTNKAVSLKEEQANNYNSIQRKIKY